MKELNAHCSECKSELVPIKLMDATTHAGFSDRGSRHVELTFAALEAKRNFFTGNTPAMGVVRGLICPDCGRIQLVGVPV